MIYRLTRQAKSDIKSISLYTIKYFGEGQVQEYLAGLEYSFDLLTDNPNMGRVFDQNIRRYVYKSHLVYYEIKEEELVIIRIRNARQKP